MLLGLEGASKVFADRVIFLRSSVKVEDDDRIGIVGVNGAGKTTLLEVLAGSLPLEEGERFAKKGLTIGYLRQNSGVMESNTIYQEMQSAFAPLLDARRRMKQAAAEMAAAVDKDSGAYHETAAEYARLEAYFSANDGYNMDVHIETVLRGMGFAEWDRQTLCGTLSGGEKTRLALAKILLQKPDLLLLDEPTNYLDVAALEWLEGYLTGIKNALVVVSHDRYFLDRVCTRIWDVTNGRIEAYRGNYTKYFQTREMVYERRLKEYEMQQERVAKLTDYIARNKARASTANMAKSREKELDSIEIIKEPPRPLLPVRLHFRFEEEPVKDVLEVKALSMRAGGSEDGRILFEGLDLHVARGQRVAIVGRNGVGKSTLFQALLGKLPVASGSARWGLNTRPAYFEQETAELRPFHTVLEEFWNRYPRVREQDIRGALACMKFGPDDIGKTIRDLSGGEKARMKFAILMFSDANVLLLDEPTNHLDLLTREALDRALMEYEGTVLAITHDRYLLSRMEWRVVELRPDGFAEYPGYEAYLASQRGADPGFSGKKTEKPKKELQADPHYRGKRQRAEDAARRKRYGEVEREISELELAVAQKQKELEDPENLRDYQRLQEIYREMDSLRDTLNSRLEEWTELECEMEGRQ